MLKYDVVSTLKYDVVLTLKSDVETTLKSDVETTLKSDVETTLKSDVETTLKSDVETTLKMGCFPDVEFNRWKLVVQHRDLKSTLKQHWNNVVCRLGLFHERFTRVPSVHRRDLKISIKILSS